MYIILKVISVFHAVNFVNYYWGVNGLGHWPTSDAGLILKQL
jgi:hypothetical protein